MKLQFRRAEPGDLPELKEIIAKGSAVGLEKALKRRFGDECSLEGLMYEIAMPRLFGQLIIIHPQQRISNLPGWHNRDSTKDPTSRRPPLFEQRSIQGL